MAKGKTPSPKWDDGGIFHEILISHQAQLHVDDF
jgi:hypothetical protein